jgi:cytidylate kinase
MVQRQRELGRRGAVLNGRDIGTVVFPDADVKFYLTASPGVRAERRFNEYREKDPALTFEQTLAEMESRDQRDTERVDSPLAIADDAVVIDSTGLTIEEVCARMLEVVEAKTKL